MTAVMAENDPTRCLPNYVDPILGELPFCTEVCGPLPPLHAQELGLMHLWSLIPIMQAVEIALKAWYPHISNHICSV